MTKLYARWGDVVTCESGHPVALITKDIETGTLYESGQMVFIPPEIEPKVGTFPRCNCGAAWWKPGTFLHFAGPGWPGWAGWRSAADPAPPPMRLTGAPDRWFI
jgi:hypothetical protein